MPLNLHIAYMAHSLRSDWNNGNAHFLRGLMRSLGEIGHKVSIFEPCTEWSIEHLREEVNGEKSLKQFFETYPDLAITTYTTVQLASRDYWREKLKECEIVILHEWNPPLLAGILLELRDELGFRLLFHDTHHRASSSPEQIRQFGLDRFDGILAFGNALRDIYVQQFGINKVWVLHEAADISVFHPYPNVQKTTDVIWVGNWGDGERSKEICEFLLQPAAALTDRNFSVFGVRYPDEGLAALREAGVQYEGYLPNLDVPQAYAKARLTVHIPRQQYATGMTGIPTIRVFEALACGIPLISAPWRDVEGLFRDGDFLFVTDGRQMSRGIKKLLEDEAAANAQALHGLETILSRHTCRHRAEELTFICEEMLS